MNRVGNSAQRFPMGRVGNSAQRFPMGRVGNSAQRFPMGRVGNSAQRFPNGSRWKLSTTLSYGSRCGWELSFTENLSYNSHRITSYNVCYTKLLRCYQLGRHIRNYSKPISSKRTLFRPLFTHNRYPQVELRF
ncbi:hypothetical protein LEP1GSC021_1190 [Leptospira noguchii str. 1993005606]|nr:hypothetical protein LEP1GSC021_1190 [Leptospira noguchii str. 1993005606]